MFNHNILGSATLAAIIITQASVVEAKTAAEIDVLAEQVTVQISNSFSYPGSGVIIAKEQDVYTVLTADHVVSRSGGEYTIRSHQNQEYRVNQVIRFQQNPQEPDLALVRFRSANNYPVATLGDSSHAKRTTTVYLSGYPLLGSVQAAEAFFLTKGVIVAKHSNLPEGYALVYDALTRVGMSGGDVFDSQGRVVGIHGRADIEGLASGYIGEFEEDLAIKTGFNFAIPINTFMALLPQAGVNRRNLQLDTTVPREDTTANRGAPQTASDYYKRGLFSFTQSNWQRALIDFNQAIELDRDYANAYFKRAILLSARGNKEQAIADYTQVIRLEPSYANAYYNRGLIFGRDLGNYQAAMVDLNHAIKLDPRDAEAYGNRGNVRFAVADLMGAIADYNQAIELNPFYAEAF